MLKKKAKAVILPRLKRRVVPGLSVPHGPVGLLYREGIRYREIGGGLGHGRRLYFEEGIAAWCGTGFSRNLVEVAGGADTDGVRRFERFDGIEKFLPFFLVVGVSRVIYFGLQSVSKFLCSDRPLLMQGFQLLQESIALRRRHL